MRTPSQSHPRAVIAHTAVLLPVLIGLLAMSVLSASVTGASLTATPSPPLSSTPVPSVTPTLSLTSTVTLTPTVPTETLTPSPTITVSLTITPTATETPTPMATLTVTPTTSPSLTPSATSTPVPAAPGDVVINEVYYNPPQTGNEAPWEWAELYNRTDRPVNLDGWSLADNVSSDALPAATIAPGHFLVVAASPSFHDNFPGFSGPTIFVADGKLGNGLANSGDRLLLRAPSGLEVDGLSWGDDAAVFDLPCPTVPAGHSLERMPFGQDTDSAADFRDQAHPSPGAGVLAPTPTPLPTPYPATVWLNEFLPAPRDVDWDGDGKPTEDDEWIELYNAGPETVNLGGWQLDDEEDGSRPHVIPPGVGIAPGGFRVFYKRDTGVSLNNAGDQVRLLYPDGSLADQHAYEAHPGYDRSWSRTVDGGGTWTGGYPPSPGASNQPPTPTPTRRPSTPAPPPQPQRVSIAQARALPPGTKVTLEGAVTVPPGVLSESAFYLQDAIAGVRVYIRHGGPPELALGDRVQVSGEMGRFHGEVEVQVDEPGRVTRLGAGEPVTPMDIRTGNVGPGYEGMLVRITGQVVGLYKSTLDLDDGSGVARAVFRELTGVQRPWVEMGELWQVVGVVGRISGEGGVLGPYRVFPRFASDVSRVPLGLPVTGGHVGRLGRVAGLNLGLLLAALVLLAETRRRRAGTLVPIRKPLRRGVLAPSDGEDAVG